MARKAFDIQVEIREIAGLGRHELVALWVKAHGCGPPRGVRHELLVRSAAWHLQARRLGGHSAGTRRLLRSAVVEVGKRFADRTSASGHAERGEDKDSGSPAHRLEDSCAVDAPLCREQGHSSNDEGEIVLRPLSGLRRAQPMDHPQGTEQQTHQSSSRHQSPPEEETSTSPMPPSPNPHPLLAVAAGFDGETSIFVPPPAAAVRPSRQRRKLQPGARLLRDWNGKTHVVDVIEGGYVFEAKVYPSLTAIAGKITGAHWSGPRFFGL